MNPTNPDPNNPTPQPDLNSAFASNGAAQTPPEQSPVDSASSPQMGIPAAPAPDFSQPPVPATPEPAQAPTWPATPASDPMAQNNMAPSSTESAPTDLSHLIGNLPQEPAAGGATDFSSPVFTPGVAPTPGEPQSNLTQPDTLAAPTIPTAGGGSRFPKWLLIVLGVVLLIVLGASGYFILHIGQNQPQPASVPATTSTETITPPASPVEAPSPEAQASDSGTLQDLTTASPTPVATASSTPAQDLLNKAKQKASPTP